MRTFWTTADLVGRSTSKREIKRATEQARLQPVMRGLFATPGTPHTLIRAARVGGVATATSAATLAGLWTPPDLPPKRAYVFPYRPEQGRLHVAVRRTTTRFRDPAGPSLPLGSRVDVVLHRTDPEVIDTARPFGVTPTLILLAHAFRSLPPERALAIVDSALNLRFLRDSDLHALAATLPAHFRPTVLAADGRADSGIETIARYLLQLAGLRVVVHPVLEGIGEVDLLVEGRVIVEVDGREYHDDEEAFARDRARDLAPVRTRYRTIRLTWRQVLFDWPSAEAAVFAALAA